MERKSIEWLKTQGYQCIRAAGSLGAFDIAGFSKKCTILVQVKANTKPGPEERARLESYPQGPFVIKQIHIWKDRAKEPEVHYINRHLEAELNKDIK